MNRYLSLTALAFVLATVIACTTACTTKDNPDEIRRRAAELIAKAVVHGIVNSTG